MPRPVVRLARFALLLSLVGCATADRLPEPADFPSHTPGELVTLHWRIERAEGAATAVGVIEVGPVDRVADVLVALEGFDRVGRVVSRSTALVTPRGFGGQPLWPFTVQLGRTGQEERFALRTVQVTPRVMRGGP